MRVHPGNIVSPAQHLCEEWCWRSQFSQHNMIPGQTAHELMALPRFRLRQETSNLNKACAGRWSFTWTTSRGLCLHNATEIPAALHPSKMREL